MNPFALYFVRNASTQIEISTSGYGHLLGNQKLPLWPNIAIRASDYGKKNGTERVYISSFQVKRAQLDQLGIKHVFLIDLDNSATDFLAEAKGLSATKVKTTKYFELLAKSDYKKAYRSIADQVLSAVKSNSKQLLIACSDPDNLPVVICA